MTPASTPDGHSNCRPQPPVWVLALSIVEGLDCVTPPHPVHGDEPCRRYSQAVLVLQRLRSDHSSAVLNFELENREYFSATISDRGDEFFEQFSERFGELLAEQDRGACAFHVLLDENGTVVGRFNLYDLDGGAAEVGYRVAERVAGRGVATSALQELCMLAAEQYGLRTLNAATSDENVASRKVLENAGFVSVGSTEVGGRAGTLFKCVVSGAPAI